MATISSVTPSGVIFPYAGSTAPDGWLLCDGTAYSRTTYVRLYNAIGTAYGNGNGTSTFNVPDFRYMFLRGKGPAISVTGTGSASSNQATFTSHGITRTGIRVRKSSGTLSSLAANTTYYAIVVNANTLAFATSYANALSNTRVTLTGANSAVIVQWEDADINSRVAINGGNTGANLGSYQEDGFDKHNHSGNYPFQVAAAGTGFAGSGLTSNSGGTVATNVVADGGNPYGAGVASNNTKSMNIYVNYIIKI